MGIKAPSREEKRHCRRKLESKEEVIAKEEWQAVPPGKEESQQCTKSKEAVIAEKEAVPNMFTGKC